MDAGATKNVKDMVSNTIGMDKGRGDDVAVVAMDFGEFNGANDAKAEDEGVVKVLKTTGYIVGVLLLLIVIALIEMYVIKKRDAANLDEDFDEDAEIDLINKKLEEMEKNRIAEGDEEDENITLEEEVKIYASENPEQVTELINKWLND
ncbi:hypothetical protein SDC9_133590 [bioreactor metagenome]|uniref:Flagellar M-ring C-terminal domain-containing protein n=1 Tax=bioreactor metagenome TaxID=1076179 RepID=A0A645DB27_9ZZZZ